MTIVFYKDGDFFVDECMCEQGDDVKKNDGFFFMPCDRH